MNVLERMFHLTERGTTVRRELLGALTSFFSVAYILFVTPSYLSLTGMDYTGVLLATCLASGVACFLSAAWNLPFMLAPGVGLNAFFTYTLCLTMGYTWSQALAVVSLSGVAYLVISLTPLREQMVSCIPPSMKNAISAGLGLFIALIGLLNSGIVRAEDGALLLGEIGAPATFLAILGMLITGVLMAWKVKGAMFTSFIAGITGVGVFYLFQPGTEGSFVSMITKQETVGTTISFIDTVIKIFPSNIVGAFYDNDVLQILIMGLFMGVVVNLIGEKGKILQDFFEAMNELFLKMVMLLAKLIPLITFCSVMILILTTGTDALLSLLALIGTLLVGLAVLIITYAIMILLIAKVSPFPFLKRYVPTALNVFSLSSSSASMPLNMDFCKKIGISQRVYSFTIPFGATINMDGAMVVFMTGVLFMAKTFGVTIDSSHIIILVVSGLLLSMATPGVPGAALVACTVLLNQMGVPMDCLPLVMIYLTITDMICTVSNTTGDVAASVIVASTEKMLDKDKYYQQD